MSALGVMALRDEMGLLGMEDGGQQGGTFLSCSNYLLVVRSVIWCHDNDNWCWDYYEEVLVVSPD